MQVAYFRVPPSLTPELENVPLVLHEVGSILIALKRRPHDQRLAAHDIQPIDQQQLAQVKDASVGAKGALHCHLQVSNGLPDLAIQHAHHAQLADAHDAASVRALLPVLNGHLALVLRPKLAIACQAPQVVVGTQALSDVVSIALSCLLQQLLGLDHVPVAALATLQVNGQAELAQRGRGGGLERQGIRLVHILLRAALRAPTVQAGRLGSLQVRGRGLARLVLGRLTGRLCILLNALNAYH